MCLGDHDAPVPEEEVWRDQDQHLPLRHLSVPLHFHKDLSESSSCRKNVRSVLLCSFLHSFSLSVSPGGHVFRSCVYPAGVRVEHLRGHHHPSLNYSLVHCYRCVCERVCVCVCMSWTWSIKVSMKMFFKGTPQQFYTWWSVYPPWYYTSSF